MHYYMFSCVFLSLTVLICGVGLLSPKFHDNLFQNAGMTALMIGCASRIPDLWGNEALPFDWFLIHCGIGLFSMGVFWKVFVRERQARFVEFARSVGLSWYEPRGSEHES